MKKYTPDELIVLTNKVCFCFYSWNQLLLFANKRQASEISGLEPKKEDVLRVLYYDEKFLHEMSELYKYFYDHDDKEILGKFAATEEERLKLREVRHKFAHVERDLNAILDKHQAWLDVTLPTNQIKDLISIIRHTRFLLGFLKSEKMIVDELSRILSLYPPDFINAERRKEILE